MNKPLVPFTPGMEGKFIPYEALEDFVSEDESLVSEDVEEAVTTFIHDNGLDAVEIPD